MSHREIDLVFRLDTADLTGEDRFCWSYDGGKTWQSFWVWNEFHQMIQTVIGRFTVDEILRPKLAPGEELCTVCRNKGRIGIMRFHRYTTGTEKVAQVWHEEDVEVSGDVSYGVRYRIERCERCGNQESDYG